MRKIQPATRAFVQVTLIIPTPRREEAITKVFLPARPRLLDRIPGAVSIDFLVRDQDVQILQGFDTFENAGAYLESGIFKEFLGELGALAEKEPLIALYNVD